MLSELKLAFQIGFLVALPFLVVDLVVATLLMSMGMMMLPPVMVSLPFKVLIFPWPMGGISSSLTWDAVSWNGCLMSVDMVIILGELHHLLHGDCWSIFAHWSGRRFGDELLLNLTQLQEPSLVSCSKSSSNHRTCCRDRPWSLDVMVTYGSGDI